MSRNIIFTILLFLLSLSWFNTEAQEEKIINIGATELTPSRSEYFSWINNTNEGATSEQTLINLHFFEYLQSTYGMNLNIYALDAGALDGKRFYGSADSRRFNKQFPNGFSEIYERASQLGIRLGIWGGPDGFGDTQEEQKKRMDQMISLCRDYNFALFKFDAVCGQLRPEKENAFIQMMEECRKYTPDLILLNHRLGLERAQQYATTFLWQGAETYIDVFSVNPVTAPHHRAGSLYRGLVPGLQRLTEDHGVCLSSSLDFWEDELILQAFNRNLILSPQIYGNPWFLKDNELPLLARIFNLHEKYKEILVEGIQLPESYGPYAVSRGDEDTRIITLRNLSWSDTVYQIHLTKEIGLRKNGLIYVQQFHPIEKYFGNFNFGDRVEIAVQAFRSCMLVVSNNNIEEPAIQGAPFQLIRNIDGQPVEMEILGFPGTFTEITLIDPGKYHSATLEGKKIPDLLNGNKFSVQFPDESLKNPYHRFLLSLQTVEIPENADALYEASAFAADNNALEIQSIKRSGWSKIPEVLTAQKAFFNQSVFINRGIWDQQLFDDNSATGFWPSRKYNIDQSVKGGCLRFDLGSNYMVDSIVFSIPDYFSLHPLLTQEAYYTYVSDDLKNWKQLSFLADTHH